ncbi:glycosyltransferase [Paraburkholderia sp. LEh10]|uniref:glycosyltransferase n=1 Tax=Paraburkholderia sp. LEh10 TaxID=2821353 RepID=UPI001AE493C8|nr:glycosyltransferase [Paraburkholderia sp. LEh10]MBP0590990.1 glycosyltransferase [Paraburkholderia sp. LEh10]
MKILHLLSTVDPRAGGPTEGVRQSGVAMASLGHEIEVASLDAPDASHVQDFPLPVHALGPGRNVYGYTPHFAGWLGREAQRFDAVIVHGLWQYHSFGAWRALRASNVPYYVYTHGMLDPWFKRTYPLKHLKKWAYWPWADYRVLRDAAAVIFTTEEERLLARQSFWLYRANECIVPFGTNPPPPHAQALREMFLSAYPQLRGKRIVLFLGRIHEKKGCDLLIHAFADHAQRDPDAHLVIAGPDPTGWQRPLQALVRSCSLDERVTWPGMLQADLKWGAFYASDVFALPSHQENFGVAVAEALACGLPVLLSDRVGVWREVESDHAGFVSSDTVSGTQRNLLNWHSLDAVSKAKMREQARKTFDARFGIASMVDGLTALLQPQTAAATRTAGVQQNASGAASVASKAPAQKHPSVN